eukprot:jgi/Mesvir1/20984/Mv26445-RA.2
MKMGQKEGVKEGEDGGKGGGSRGGEAGTGDAGHPPVRSSQHDVPEAMTQRNHGQGDRQGDRPQGGTNASAGTGLGKRKGVDGGNQVPRKKGRPPKVKNPNAGRPRKVPPVTVPAATTVAAIVGIGGLHPAAHRTAPIVVAGPSAPVVAGGSIPVVAAGSIGPATDHSSPSIVVAAERVPSPSLAAVAPVVVAADSTATVTGRSSAPIRAGTTAPVILAAGRSSAPIIAAAAASTAPVTGRDGEPLLAAGAGTLVAIAVSSTNTIVAAERSGDPVTTPVIVAAGSSAPTVAGQGDALVAAGSSAPTVAGQGDALVAAGSSAPTVAGQGDALVAAGSSAPTVAGQGDALVAAGSSSNDPANAEGASSRSAPAPAPITDHSSALVVAVGSHTAVAMPSDTVIALPSYPAVALPSNALVTARGGTSGARSSGGRSRTRYVDGSDHGARMHAALAAVEHQGFSLNQAARDFCVSRNSLRRRLTGQVDVGAAPGTRQVLPLDAERELAGHIVRMEAQGRRVTWGQVCQVAVEMAQSLGIRNFAASKSWLEAFKRRNPEVVKGTDAHASTGYGVVAGGGNPMGDGAGDGPTSNSGPGQRTMPAAAAVTSGGVAWSYAGVAGCQRYHAAAELAPAMRAVAERNGRPVQASQVYYMSQTGIDAPPRPSKGSAGRATANASTGSQNPADALSRNNPPSSGQGTSNLEGAARPGLPSEAGSQRGSSQSVEGALRLFSRERPAGRMTVISCVSAKGDCMDPLFVLAGEQRDARWVNEDGSLAGSMAQPGVMPPGVRVAYTVDGCVTEAVSERMIVPFFCDQKTRRAAGGGRGDGGGRAAENGTAVENGSASDSPADWVVLIVDCHVGRTMATPGTLRSLSDARVVCVCMPPHASCALDPLDAAVLRPFKSAYRSRLDTWQRSYGSSGDALTLPEQVVLVYEALEMSHGQDAVRAGFKDAGIWPLAADGQPLRVDGPPGLGVGGQPVGGEGQPPEGNDHALGIMGQAYGDDGQLVEEGLERSKRSGAAARRRAAEGRVRGKDAVRLAEQQRFFEVDVRRSVLVFEDDLVAWACANPYVDYPCATSDMTGGGLVGSSKYWREKSRAAVRLLTAGPLPASRYLLPLLRQEAGGPPTIPPSIAPRT